MKFENTKVFNFEGAFRGMRNPFESWSKSDSHFDCVSCLCTDCARRNDEVCGHDAIYIGPSDMELAQKLIHGGSEHRKFLRQIVVSVDITAPIYWWKEFDTYKIGTVANSTSTMHKIHSAPITIDCFEIDDYEPSLQLIDPVHLGVRIGGLIEDLEQLRQRYLQCLDESKNPENGLEKQLDYRKMAKKYWKELIRWLPESWLQTRTVTMNYENILSICNQRKGHKLNEWSGLDNNSVTHFIAWAHSLPYANELIFLSELRSEGN